MSTTYTPNAKLAKPGVADRNWNAPLNANADALDALSPVGALCVSPAQVPSASLAVRVSAGRYAKRDGTIGVYAGTAAATLPANATCVLYLTDAGVLTVGTAGYPTTSHVPLGTVVTGATAVTSVADDRVVCATAGSDSRPYLPLAGGALQDGAAIAAGTTVGTRLGTTSTQKLGFWGATPVVRPGTYVQTYATKTKTLNAYTSSPASTAYTGLANDQTTAVYAKLADLNALRASYENLRAFAENATQVLNALTSDLKAAGLIG